MQAMQRYSPIIITFVSFLFIVYAQPKLINEAKAKIANVGNGKSLIDRLGGNGVDFTDKLDRYVQRLDEHGLVDETGLVPIFMDAKQFEKLNEKAMKAMNGSYAGGKIAQSMNDATSRRRLPADWLYYEDDEGILDDWIDSLSDGEAIYYYNLFNDAYYDDNYDDNYNDFGEYYDGYHNQFDDAEFYEEEEDTPFLPTKERSCKKQCSLKTKFDGLRKCKCNRKKGCTITCKKGACSKEYIKPKKDVKKILFTCDACKGAEILITGSMQKSEQQVAVKTSTDKKEKRASTDITANFRCSKRCSPRFVGFYNLKTANIKPNTNNKKYPKNSQINFRLIDEVNIDIKRRGFKDVSIYTQEVNKLTVTVNAAKSFQEILLDVRGVDEAVEINCNKPNACNKLVIRYQKERCKKTETIKITCGANACKNLEFIQETFEDKFGWPPKVCLGKQTPVSPEIKIGSATAFKAFKDVDFNTVLSDDTSCTTNTIIWYDPRSTHNEGLYTLETGVCLKVTKNKADALMVEIKRRNKGHSIQRTHDDERTHKGMKQASKWLGRGSTVGGATSGLVSLAKGAAVGGGVFGAIVGLVPLAFDSINELILYTKNKNLQRFHIKWEDQNTDRLAYK